MRVVFYEPAHAGHHYPYLARMLRGFVGLDGVEAVVATTEAGAASEEYGATLRELEGSIEVRPACAPIARGTARIAAQRLREVRRVAERLAADHVVMMYADGVWPLAELRRAAGGGPLAGVPVEIGVFRGGFTYDDARSSAARVKRWLWRSMLGRGLVARVHAYDELLHAFSSVGGGGGSAVELMPEPVELHEPRERGEARSAFGLDPDRRWLACIGMNDRRKGVDLALASLRAVRSRPGFEDVGLFLAGPIRDGIGERLAGEDADLVRAGAVATADRFLTGEEMASAASSADAVLAPYPSHSGRSSIILWAAAAGRPVVGAARGTIGYVIGREGLGRVADPRETGAFSDAVASTLAEPWSDEDAARVRRYAEFHSIENYGRVASELVRRRLADRSVGGER